ncbi:uncharacterized protein tnxba [Salminus brasiliensis]|uniref:uncharacterized protein tnxba n=1 Tax=Salminus brasiliensis TaxID=930266 RepID=UPI003B8361EB
MLISLAFLFLLSPLPSLQASIGERKNSTKPTPHAINLNVLPKPVASVLNVKSKTSSSAKPAGTNNAQKTSKETLPSSSTITVIISEACVQRDPQKDAVNTTRIQEVELSIKPGSPLMMKHHISLEISACTEGCDPQMEALQGRVEFLEKEVSALKKKCSLCSEEQCPNNCSGQGRCERGKCVCQSGFGGPDCSDASCPSNCNSKGKCVNGKCVCQTGFTGLDCSKGTGGNKKNTLSVETMAMKVSGSGALKPETVTKTKLDKTIFEKKVDDEKDVRKVEPTAKPSITKPASTNSTVKDLDDDTRNRVLLKDGKRQEQATGGKATAQKTESDKQLQTTDLLINISEKPSTKQEKLKDVLVNHSVTQSAEKKSNGTSKVLSSLAKGAKTSADAKQTTSAKVTHPQLNVTSTEDTKKIPQGNVTTTVKGGASGRQKVEKHGNGTVSVEKDKSQVQSNATLIKDVASGKKKVEKHVTSSTEKDKKLHQANVTLPGDGASTKKKVEKHVNVTSSTEKDKKLHQANVTLPGDGASTKKKVEKHINGSAAAEKDQTPLKEGLPGKKKIDSHLNVTSTEKDKKPPHSNVTTALKTGKKKLESHVNVTAPSTKDKKVPQGNEMTTLKEVTASKKKVEKRVDEKDKRPHQVNATLLREETSEARKVEKHRNVTSPSEKDKKPQQGSETPALKDATFAKKKVEKQVNVTMSTEKDKKLQQVSATLLKEEEPAKRKTEKQVNVTTSAGKPKPHLQANATLPKDGQKKEVNGTASPDKKLRQGNVTLLKEETSGIRRVNTVTVSEGKHKKQLQSNATAGLQEKLPGKEKLESQGNTTAPSGKDKTLQQDSKTTALKEGGAKTKKESSGINTMVSTEKDKKVHVNGTAPLKEATSGRRKVEKHANVTASAEKDRKLPQTIVTLLKEESPAKKKVDVVTVSEEKDKKQLQLNVTTLARESIRRTVESEANVTNVEAKTPKMKDVGSVELRNITATGFVITWEAPQGVFRNFTVTRREVLTGSKDEEDAQEAWKSDDKDSDKGTITGNEAEVHSSNRTSKVQVGKAERKSTKKFTQVLPGSARSFHFRNLQPQTRYLVSLYSSRPGGPSKLHRLFVSTGPEPPTELMFSNITETSLSVSWTKPKSTVTGFRVTYSNTANGETGSMSVDSQLSHVLISKLSAGSSYDISVRSVLETVESEPTTASVTTVADPPTDLQAVNITDTKALLIWKPAQAKVDHYILSYGSAKSPNVTVTVMLSGSTVELQLRNLDRFTLYTVKIVSQINGLQSRPISTTFTTTSGVKLQAVTPTVVTYNSAVISWKAPRLAFRSYRLTYQHRENVKEVVLIPTVTRYELTGLAAFSNYTVKVDGESEGQYINVVSTTFTTAQAPHPYPTDCSQVQQNGVKESGEAEVYPEGKDGEPVWVYCDMDTEGGGWTVFQRRVDGSTDFFRSWKDYSKGFGFLSAEFWLGNDILHSLTSLTPMTLRIDLRYGNDTAYAHYSNFTVGPEDNHYTITLSGYSGTAGDSMKYHNGRPFSTKDKDPNPLSIHCAKAYMGGWWYKNCYKANLNGLYSTFSENQGVVWIDWKGKDVSIPYTEMKLRPASLSHITSRG